MPPQGGSGFSHDRDGRPDRGGRVGRQGQPSAAARAALYRKFCKVPYELAAFTLTLGMQPFDTSGVAALCRELGVPYAVKVTEIGRIIFEERKEKNPCALCAKMRRGALNDLCVENGFNKLALGHHRDDAIETLFLSLLYEGRLHTFHPVTYLSRTGITQIRRWSTFRRSMWCTWRRS
jgi:tRNA(Ile)-lysidine synthase TilS/MesJ